MLALNPFSSFYCQETQPRDGATHVLGGVGGFTPQLNLSGNSPMDISLGDSKSSQVDSEDRLAERTSQGYVPEKLLVKFG